MTGRDGFIRARNSGDVDVAGQDVRNGPLFSEYAKRDEGTARYNSVVDGVVRRVAFRKLDGYPLFLSAGVAEETVLAAVNSRARNLFVGALAASLLRCAPPPCCCMRCDDAIAMRSNCATARRVTAGWSRIRPMPRL